MARLSRAEVIDPNRVTIVHVISRTVRRCFLLGDDPISGKNFDHRKVWIEELLEHFAGSFGIDFLAFSLLSNHYHYHYHLILRARPDVVASWDDTEVARRWLKPFAPSDRCVPTLSPEERRDAFLAKLTIDEASDPIGAVASQTLRRRRCNARPINPAPKIASDVGSGTL